MQQTDQNIMIKRVSVLVSSWGYRKTWECMLNRIEAKRLIQLRKLRNLDPKTRTLLNSIAEHVKDE